MPSNSRKGGAKHSARDRRSSSRQSTPLSVLGDTAPPTPSAATPTSAAPIAAPTSVNLPKETAYIHTSTAALVSTDPSIETLIENANGGSTKNNDPPPARELHLLQKKIHDSVNRFMIKRGEACDRSVRQLAQKRKERIAMEREQEAARAAEDAARIKRERDEESEKERDRKKSKKAGHGKKRSADEMEVEANEHGERGDAMPTVGAHGVARQDGVGLNQGTYATHCSFFSFARERHSTVPLT